MNSPSFQGIVTNKMRDQLYLKHLRQVQKIKNRQNQNLQKSLAQYKSITQLHQKNKIFNLGWKKKQQNHSIETKNNSINHKINSIKSGISFQSPQKLQERSHSLHYRYRQKQQQQIQLQNVKLMKGILSQRGTVLPYLNKTINQKSINN